MQKLKKNKTNKQTNKQKTKIRKYKKPNQTKQNLKKPCQNSVNKQYHKE